MVESSELTNVSYSTVSTAPEVDTVCNEVLHDIEKPKRKRTKKYSGNNAIEGTISTNKNCIGYCSECGSQVFEGDTVCRSCGATFNTSSTEELVTCPNCNGTIDLEGYRGKFKCPFCHADLETED